MYPGPVSRKGVGGKGGGEGGRGVEGKVKRVHGYWNCYWCVGS